MLFDFDAAMVTELQEGVFAFDDGSVITLSSGGGGGGSGIALVSQTFIYWNK